jgi:hypothetical protein
MHFAEVYSYSVKGLLYIHDWRHMGSYHSPIPEVTMHHNTDAQELPHTSCNI